MCKVIAVSNQKGGVGKTVSCVNLGIGLAQSGKKVLLIDADPQGSLTISLGYEEPDEMEWSFWGLLPYAIEGIIAFSTKPLVIATICGLFCCLAALGGVAFVVARYFLSGDPVQGWASLICVILFLGGIQLLCIGVLGQYLAKTYLETKHRPLYIIQSANTPIGGGTGACPQTRI